MERLKIMEENKPHVRRKRYSGTHPKRFEEKYKELNPEKYAETIEHVISKGMTPAGMHISICVNATFGYGGHTRKMLERLEGQGHMYALDIDPIEIKKTTKRLRDAGFGEDILTVKQMNFADIDKLVPESGLFDFVLADLGVSSMQIDNPERGFSYKVDGPLDLRLNPETGVSAAERLAELDEDEIIGMLVENSDEPYAEEIAAQIMRERKRKHPIDTTTALRQVIEKALEFLPEAERREMIKKSCQRTFQALRIDVNSEFEVLDAFLSKLPGILAPGGRVAILTFHSGEDRMVKKYFKQMEKDGIYSEAAKDVIRPSAEECVKNSRARSTKMRWAVKA